jgi:hypothetical protein
VTRAANATLYSSEDGVEGFKAFAAKRKPVWKGRYPRHSAATAAVVPKPMAQYSKSLSVGTTP